MKNFEEHLRYFLYRLRLGTLVRNFRASKEWSTLVNQQLDLTQDKVIILDEYRALVGHLVVWTCNYPYAYGHPDAYYHLFKLLSKSDFLSLTEEDCREIEFLSRHYMKKFHYKLPDRKTVYRLRQAERRARGLL